MDTMFLCPACGVTHDEPLEAGLGHHAICFSCAVEADGHATDGVFAAAPPAELAVAA